MKLPVRHTFWKPLLAMSTSALLSGTLALGMVTPTAKTFPAGEKSKVKGVIISREGDSLKLRGDDDSVGTIDLTSTTKIQLKHGMFGRKNAMETSSLVPGLHIEAEGKGSEKGDLIADKVIFDPNSMRASRQIDARVSPLEGRTSGLEGRAGQLEGRAGQLESRAGQIEGRQTTLESDQKQTEQQVGQVKQSADQANMGVNAVNGRVSNLDTYDSKYSATVYFKLNSTVLSPQSKKDLDDLAQKALNEKGYMIEVAGYADKTGNAAVNQEISEKRADAVIHYLEQNGNIPIHRILAPAGLGTSHEVADNKTTAGRKMNRRVEVKVLVNQGLVASSGSGSGATQATGSGATTGTGATTTPSTQPTQPQQ